jgi:hypothetical protein
VDREYPKATAEGPRAALEEWLEFQRQGVVEKVSGLADADAASSPVPSGTSVCGVVRHLANVETWWFQGAMQGATEVPARIFEDAWAVRSTTSLAEAIDAYVSACERSRDVQRTVTSLGQPLVHAAVVDLDYCWVLTHMVEETARHLGHLDVLRELNDGATGI